MLIARGSTRIGHDTMAWGVAFAPHVRISVVERHGLTLDTRFVPPSPQAADPDPCLYVLLRGTWQAHGGPAFEAPAAFVVSEEHLEGGAGARSLTYRTDPRVFAMIEVHLRAEDTSLRAANEPVPLDLHDAAWSAACDAIAHHDDPSLVHALCTLLDSLVAQSLLRREVAVRARRPASAPLRLLWKALRPMAEQLDLLPTVQQISDSIGTTPREVDRRVREFLAASHLVGRAWRPASLHLRLKMAVILLSAADANVTDVARIVGYGSADAMARAFRDVDLPSPRTIHEALRAC
jgi:AraC-like DNA-binding protein